jgi:hypothetical protein
MSIRFDVHLKPTAIFQVLKAVRIKTAVLWVVVPCGLGEF